MKQWWQRKVKRIKRIAIVKWHHFWCKWHRKQFVYYADNYMLLKKDKDYHKSQEHAKRRSEHYRKYFVLAYRMGR